MASGLSWGLWLPSQYFSLEISRVLSIISGFGLTCPCWRATDASQSTRSKTESLLGVQPFEWGRALALHACSPRFDPWLIFVLSYGPLSTSKRVRNTTRCSSKPNQNHCFSLLKLFCHSHLDVNCFLTMLVILGSGFPYIFRSSYSFFLFPP